MDRKLTENERLEILVMYKRDGATQRSVAKDFNAKYPNRSPPISHATVGKLFKRFQETGSVHDRQRSGRPRTSTNAQTCDRVCELLLNNPHKSLRKLSKEIEVSVSSIQRIISAPHFHPYKIKPIQELHSDYQEQSNCEASMDESDLDIPLDQSNCEVSIDHSTCEVLLDEINCELSLDQSNRKVSLDQSICEVLLDQSNC